MLNKFQQIPKSMQLVVAALIGIGLLGGAALIDRRAFFIAAGGIALVVGAMFVWQFYVSWRGRQRTKAMTGQISAHSAGRPSSLNDPAHIATLDRLRENFSRGIEKFQAVGRVVNSPKIYRRALSRVCCFNRFAVRLQPAHTHLLSHRQNL